MKKSMLWLVALLFTATLAVAQQTPPQPVTPPAGELPQIVAYDNEGLLGDHIHIFGDVTDLGKWAIVSRRWSLWQGAGRFLMRKTLRARG